jgi:hypothetical protein
VIGDSIVAVARRFLFVREDGANRGLWVELFLRFVGCVPGDSWCAAFVSYVLNIVYRGKSPVLKSGSCQEILDDCHKKGYVVTGPVQPGDLVFSMDGDHAHHIAIATTAGTVMDQMLNAIAGNTSEDGTSSNGTGVFEHHVSRANKAIARLPQAA